MTSTNTFELPVCKASEFPFILKAAMGIERFENLAYYYRLLDKANYEVNVDANLYIY